MRNSYLHKIPKLLLGASALAILALAQPAGAQQPSTLTNMPFASTPFSGSELFYVVQGGGSRKITYNVLLSLLNPVSLVVNVASYGATGNGVTDDTAAIQAAANVVLAAGGGHLYFPCGSFLISKSLQIPSNTLVTGAGACSKIIATSAGWTISTPNNFGMLNLFNVSNVEIASLQLYGTTSATQPTTPKLMYFQQVNNVDIHDNTFQNSGYEGIWMAGASDQQNTAITIHNNYAFNVAIVGNGGLPAFQLNCSPCSANDNMIVNPGTGIALSGQLATAVGNVIVNPLVDAIGIGDGNPPAGNIVVGNTIVINPSTHSVNGVRLLNGPGSVPPALPSGLINVTGNHVRTIAPQGLGFTAICYNIATATDSSLTGNTCDITGQGTGFAGVGSAAGTTIFANDNVVKFIGESAISNGFSFHPGGSANSLTVVSSHNRVYGLGNSYSITGISGTSSPYTVTATGIPAEPIPSTITVSGVTPSSMNGTYTITASAAGSFTATTTATGTYVSGGATSFGSSAFTSVLTGGQTLVHTQLGDYATGGLVFWASNSYGYTRDNIAFGFPPSSKSVASATFTGGSSSPPAIAGGSNGIASITRNSQGNYSVAFTAALATQLASGSYQIQFTPRTAGSVFVSPQVLGTPTASGFNFLTENFSGAATDFNNMDLVVTILF